MEVLLPDGTRTQVLESATTLIDKGFLRGDIVRPRRASPASSSSSTRGQLGQIVDLQTQVQVQRVLTGEEIQGWFAASDLVAATRINHGDHVVSGDWIGVVEEVFEMAMIELGDSGAVRRVCDIGNTFSVGTATDTIKQMLLERGEGILAMFLGASDFKRVSPRAHVPSKVPGRLRPPVHVALLPADPRRQAVRRRRQLALSQPASSSLGQRVDRVDSPETVLVRH